MACLSQGVPTRSSILGRGPRRGWRLGLGAPYPGTVPCFCAGPRSRSFAQDSGASIRAGYDDAGVAETRGTTRWSTRPVPRSCPDIGAKGMAFGSPLTIRPLVIRSWSLDRRFACAPAATWFPFSPVFPIRFRSTPSGRVRRRSEIFGLACRLLRLHVTLALSVSCASPRPSQTSNSPINWRFA